MTRFIGEHSDLDTRVLCAVTELGAGVTLDELAGHLGRHRQTVYGALVRLRASGLVEWEDSRQRTLRSKVAAVALAVTLLVAAMIGGAAIGRAAEPDLPARPAVSLLT